MYYILLVNIVLILFFLLYRFRLKNLTFFRWNRVYLLSVLLISLVLPLGLYIQYELPKELILQLPMLDLRSNLPTGQEPVVEQGISWNWETIGMNIYWIGVAVGSLRLLLSYLMLRKRMANPKQNDSFSFFSKVILGEQVQQNTVLQKHEEIHVKEKHSVDLLLLDLVTLFNWFNPVCYLLRKDMKLLHECLVDQRFEGEKVQYAELLVAYALNSHASSLSYEFSNQSFLKERISMLFKEKSTKKKLYSYLGILPILAISTLLTVNCKGSGSKEDSNRDDSTSMVSAPETSEVSNPIDSSNLSSEALAEAKKETVRFPEPKIVKDDNKKEIVRDSPVRFPEPKVKSGGGKKEISVSKAGESISKSDQSSQSSLFNYGSLEVNPEYPGGLSAYREKIMTNFSVPKSSLKAGTKGLVQIAFTIGKEGIAKDIEVTKSLDPELDAAFVEAIRKTEGWLPGIHNGKKVPVRFSLPLRIDLSEN